MKIAVLFPGIGYHCDKPLLYYGGKLAKQYEYEVVRVSFTGLSRVVEDAFKEALIQAERCLENIEWEQYEDILFMSKSIGTAVACAYAEKHEISCRNIYYTPLVQTFDYSPRPGVVFHGTEDSWAQTEKITAMCGEYGFPIEIIEGADHALEVWGDTCRSLSILDEVMKQTQSYLKEEVCYRRLTEEEICRELFARFIRRQNVTRCRRREKGEWVIREDPFVDDWTEEDYHFLTACLKNTVATGGFVYAAFYDKALKGFVSVEAGLFGGGHRYLDLTSIHVSEDMRGRGIGKKLFRAAAMWARQKGAAKLYISAHSAVETQAFYHAMGCVEAQMYHQEHVEREPYDCQLEYCLEKMGDRQP